MADPLRSIIFHERAGQVIGLALLLALLASIYFVLAPNFLNDGHVVDAKVVRVSMVPVGSGFGGDRPILTVRLPDGSIRQMEASWPAAGNCAPGDHISLFQQGTALQVVLRGCKPAAHAS